MHAGIIVGNEKAKPGAFSTHLNSHEYEWNKELADMIASAMKEIKSNIIYRDRIGVIGAYSEADRLGSKICIELHFNSSHSQSASGTGILYYPGSKNGRRLAEAIFKEMKPVLGLPDWPKGTSGIATPYQASGSERRGEYSLGAGKAPAVLLEPFFGSNSLDCHRAHERKNDLAEAIASAMRSYLS